MRKAAFRVLDLYRARSLRRQKDLRNGHLSRQALRSIHVAWPPARGHLWFEGCLEGETYEAIARVVSTRILLPSEQRAKIGHEQNGDLEGAGHCP